MKLSMKLTRNRLAATLRWFALDASHLGKADVSGAHAPSRFARAARKAAARGKGVAEWERPQR
jgi:hypothetical protein